MKLIRTTITAIAALLFCITSFAQNKKDDNHLEEKVRQIFQYDNTQNWVALRNSLADTMQIFSLNGVPQINNPDTIPVFLFMMCSFLSLTKIRLQVRGSFLNSNKIILKNKKSCQTLSSQAPAPESVLLPQFY